MRELNPSRVCAGLGVTGSACVDWPGPPQQSPSGTGCTASCRFFTRILFFPQLRKIKLTEEGKQKAPGTTTESEGLLPMDLNISTFMGPRWGWLTVWVICTFVALFFVMMLTVGGVHPWSDILGSSVDGYHHEQCESVDKTSFLLQFHNFWSNFAYFAAGLLVVWLSDFMIGKAIGIVFIFLAFSSAWFHGTITATGQTFDMVGVYCALTVLIAYAFIETIPLEQDSPGAWIAFIVGLVLGVVAGILRPGGLLSVTPFKVFDSDLFTPVLVLVLGFYMFLVIWRRNFQFWSPILAPILGFIASGLLALIFKFTDGDKNGFLADHDGVYSKCLYDPHGVIQGHALWHFFSAVMFVCFFEYIRSVNGRSRSIWPWRISSDAGN